MPVQHRAQSKRYNRSLILACRSILGGHLESFHWRRCRRNNQHNRNRQQCARSGPLPPTNAMVLGMSKPTPQPIEAGELKRLARSVLEEDGFPYLASMDGDQPRLRPVSPVKTDGFTVYVANLRSYHKTVEIAANPKVELCYLASDHNQVRITGVARIVDDQRILEEIWNANPLLRQYLGKLDNPELIVYRIEPHRVRYMREWALEYHDIPLD